MTSELFSEWLAELTKRFQLSDATFRCSSTIVRLIRKFKMLTRSHVLAFLMPNATSSLQPCEMGIIKNLKVKYRRPVAKRLIDSVEMEVACDINVLDAVHTVRSAWNAVTQHTVSNCFTKAGFQLSMCSRYYSSTLTNTSGDDDDDDDREDDLPLTQLLLKDTTLTDYAAVDNNVETCVAIRR
jgi:hypothetical protein